MIKSADEFIRLRSSDIKEEQDQAGRESADNETWRAIIQQHPEYKIWVVYNKTISLEILELLAHDKDAEVRAAVARKRKITDRIFSLLSNDADEGVRHALIYNTKLSKEKKRAIRTDDSLWLRAALEEQIKRS